MEPGRRFYIPHSAVENRLSTPRGVLPREFNRPGVPGGKPVPYGGSRDRAGRAAARGGVMKLRIIERGFLGPHLVFEKPAVWIEPGKAVADIGARHAQAMAAGDIDMVELEFPDLPPDDRYFRIGVNPAGMRLPVNLSSLMDE